MRYSCLISLTSDNKDAPYVWSSKDDIYIKEKAKLSFIYDCCLLTTFILFWQTLCVKLSQITSKLSTNKKKLQRNQEDKMEDKLFYCNASICSAGSLNMFYRPVSANICKKLYYVKCGSQMHFNCLFCQVCGTLYACMLAKDSNTSIHEQTISQWENKNNWGGDNFANCHIIVIFLIKTVM